MRLVSLCLCFALSPGGLCPLVAQDVTLTINAVPDGTPIPAGVYGANELGFSGTLNRHGGNRHTGWNWENNASNAGSDYLHNSDSYLGTQAGLGSSTAPGALLQAWVNADRTQGAATMVTLPVAGYVAADMAGPVSEAQKAPSARWKQVVAAKGSAFALVPNATDGVVYLDEMVNFAVQKFGLAAAGGIRAYCLDNEPGLWADTHPRLHPARTGYAELFGKQREAAAAALAVDPGAEIYGPVSYGWSEYLNMQNAPDAATYNATYGNFMNYYLAQMKSASQAAGRRLLHRYDMHWYPEAQGDSRIVFASSGPGSANDIEARLQAPRSLWDAEYIEKSWITQYTTNGQGLRLLPRLQENIARYYPGTGLAMTEYNYGASGHISGGLAQVDVLGILGEYGTVGCYWPLSGDQSYVVAGFRMYRNYDGAGSTYGSLALSATASGNALAAVHAARASSGAQKLTVIALNRSQNTARSARVVFTLPSGQTLAGVKAFRLDGTGPQVAAVAAPTFSGAEFTQTLPALSATLYEVTLGTAVVTGYGNWQQQVFGSQASNPTVAGETADPDRDGVPNLLEYALGRSPLAGETRPALATFASGLSRQAQWYVRRSLGDVQLALQSSPSLGAGASWTTVDPNTLPLMRETVDGTTERWTVTLPTGPQAFYRLQATRSTATTAAAVRRVAARARR